MAWPRGAISMFIYQRPKKDFLHKSEDNFGVSELILGLWMNIDQEFHKNSSNQIKISGLAPGAISMFIYQGPKNYFLDKSQDNFGVS